MYYRPGPHEELLASAIVDCAFPVHSTLGPGLLESIYELCFCHELKEKGIPYERQVSVPLIYRGIDLPLGVRLDVLVDKRIICELKAVESLTPVFMAQIITQLKLANHHLGFLINFNVAKIKDGIRRVII
jgi:GxxExxY protein